MCRMKMCRMKRLGLLFCWLLVAVFTVRIFAGDVTSSLPTSVNIQPNCQFLSSNVSLSFGSYDPIVTNITKTQDAVTSFQLRCIRGTTASISMNQGVNALGSTRRMRGSGSDYLNYELYTSASKSTVWNTSNIVSYTADNPNPRQFSIYGQIPAGQDVSSGSY